MIFDSQRSIRIINDAPNAHIIKIFFYLAFHQPDDGITGYKIEKQQLQFDLKLGRTIFFTSLSWLKKNLCIHEIKDVDESDFMVNPYIVMNNGDRQARIDEWKRRMKLDMEKERKNNERRRLQQLKAKNI